MYKTENNSESSEEFHIPVVSDLIESFNHYKAMETAINNGITIDELCKNNNDLFDLMQNDIADVKDYTIVRMPIEHQKPTLYGEHSSNGKYILINTDAIDALPDAQQTAQFIKTLRHEIEHALQEKAHNDLVENRHLINKDLEVFRKLAEELNKKVPLQTLIKQYNQQIDKIAIRRGLTSVEIQQLKDFAELKVVNKQKSSYYKKHKNTIENYQRNTKNLSDIEIQNYYNNLPNTQKEIIDEYYRLFNNYTKANYEINADNIGQKISKEIIDNANTKATKGITGIRQEWTVRAGRNDSSKTINRKEKSRIGQNLVPSEASEEITPEQLGAINRNRQTHQDENKIEKATRDSLYKWYGEVEKARFDVDKDLNQFNKITKSTAKDFSKKTGLRVSDKMIREILPFLRERTEVPEALGRKDLTEFYNKLSQADITRLTKLADDVCSKFDKYWQNYKDAKGIISDEDIENHISHLWNVGKKQKGILTNYFNTNSRFAKPRTIEFMFDCKNFAKGL